LWINTPPSDNVVMRRLSLGALFVLACIALAVASKEFTLPHPAQANSYPAHDDHAGERVSIAIDLYDSPRKADIFKVNWREHDYLPAYLIVSNEGDEPIALTDMHVQWVTSDRSKIQPATDEDLARRLSRVKRRGDERPLPVPIPRGPDVGVSKDARREIEAAQFRASAVEPHSTRAGFLFFDVENIREPLAGAHVYISGIKDANGQELIFFDIPLDKYLNTTRAK
jgi:hypothetical protein